MASRQVCSTSRRSFWCDLHADALDGDGAVEMMVPGAVDVAEAAAADQLPNFKAVGDPVLRSWDRGGSSASGGSFS